MEINVSDKMAMYIKELVDIADCEKVKIANALTTATDAKESPIQDNDDFANLCSVLGRYNKLLSIIKDS